MRAGARGERRQVSALDDRKVGQPFRQFVLFEYAVDEISVPARSDQRLLDARLEFRGEVTERGANRLMIRNGYRRCRLDIDRRRIHWGRLAGDDLAVRFLEGLAISLSVERRRRDDR